jgi:iron complex transport system substrate-binding protein
MQLRGGSLKRRGILWLAAGAAALACGAARAAAAPGVMSLDQCADQYVMALAPRASIVGVSYRAGDPDSYLRAQAAGLPRRRATAESILTAAPKVAVSYWGGDPLLLRSLSRRGIKVVQINEATDFAGVRGNVRRVAAALDQTARGEALIARMDGQLGRARDAWKGRPALYLTSAGYTAGRGTLIHAMLEGAGLRDAAQAPGFGRASVERLLLDPPMALVLGFFDRYGLSRQNWAPGRQGLMRRLARTRAIDSLPGGLLGCPAWFAGDAAQSLAEAARRR